jgi:hypothetical protein
VINLFVNGTRLQDLVRSVERPLCEAEGNAGLAGNYAGVAIGPTQPASHYLGEPARKLALRDS